jgi:hypothetical protein
MLVEVDVESIWHGATERDEAFVPLFAWHARDAVTARFVVICAVRDKQILDMREWTATTATGSE